MKKFKAFTLIELIVAIAVFGILMTAVIQLVAPINDAATGSKVLNNQQMVENSILTYIGENTRYAGNLLIAEEGVSLTTSTGTSITVNDAEDAIDAFFAYYPVNTKGVLAHSDKNRKMVSVICFDHETAYTYVNKTYTGRLISSLDSYDPSTGKLQPRTQTLDFASTNLSPKGDKMQYIAFGNDYYGPGEFRLNIALDSTAHALKMSASSEYYYSNGKVTGKSSETAARPTEGTYELRNYGTGGYIFKCLTKTSGATGINIGKTDSKKVYFVFTKDCESMEIDRTLSQAAPTLGSGTYDVTTSGTINTGGSSSGNSSGNSGNSGNNGGTNNGGTNNGNGNNSGNNGGTNNGGTNNGNGNNSGNNGGTNNGGTNNGNGNNSGNNGGTNNGGTNNGNGNNSGNNGGTNNGGTNNGNGNNSGSSSSSNTGPNGAAAPPASVNNSTSATVEFSQWNGVVTKTVNFDSNVWKCTQDGNKLTFESPEYGKVVIQVFDWGGYSLDSLDSTAEDALRLGYYYSDGAGNNSFARDFSKQETKDFWAQYGIKLD